MSTKSMAILFLFTFPLVVLLLTVTGEHAWGDPVTVKLAILGYPLALIGGMAIFFLVVFFLSCLPQVQQDGRDADAMGEDGVHTRAPFRL